MATYLVRLKGENFLIDEGAGPRRQRFRSARLVEAANPAKAAALARRLIRTDPRIEKRVLNEASDPPVVALESVREVPAMAYDAQNRANAFYWEKEKK